MKVKRDLQVWKCNIYILPTIEIRINDMIYMQKNFAISFHFLCFHVRFLFLESGV